MGLPPENDNREGLKRDFIEDALSLAESFARQGRRAEECGDAQTADQAKRNVERFFQEALDMIGKLRNEEEAEAFTERLTAIDQGLQTHLPKLRRMRHYG